jgi:hypothetical protein
MNRFKVSENFFLDEFVPPDIYNERGQRAIQLIDIRVFMAAQFLRDTIGKPMVVNNWWNGGKFTQRGLRRHDSKTGARWSQHKYGRGFDFHVSNMTVSEVHAIIMQHEEMLINRQWITVIEDKRDTPTWVHCDCRNTGLDQILIVRP